MRADWQRVRNEALAHLSAEQWRAIDKAKAARRARGFDPGEPRDEGGRWTSGGGDGGDGKPTSGSQSTSERAIAAHVAALKKFAATAKAYIASGQAKEVLKKVAGSEKGKEYLSFALQTLLTHGTGLDPSTWGSVESAVDHIVHNFSEVSGYSQAKAHEVMKAGTQALIAAREAMKKPPAAQPAKSSDGGEEDGVILVLQALLAMLEQKKA